MRVEPPQRLPTAPMVFVGYGLVVPETNYDDLAGVELRGKVAVYTLSDARKARSRFPGSVALSL